MATTPNPYDRRKGPDSAHRRAMADMSIDAYAGPVDLLADGKRAFPGLTMQWLHDIAETAFAQGFNAGEGTEERRMEDVLPRQCAVAWEKGHVVGQEDGKRELLETINVKFDRRANELVEALDAAYGNPRTTREKLREQLAEARQLLATMIDAHHNGFVDVPF